MSFADIEKAILKPKRNAVDRLDEFLESLPEAERTIAIRILMNASQKKAMYAFREEGFPLSYITLANWKDKQSGVQQ
jgi:hypothetical protein